jgi:hypothetical protein
MKLEEILQLIKNKLNVLQENKNSAYMQGDMEKYYNIEAEIAEVEKIIEKLNS